MEDFKILLGAAIDIQRAQNNINSQIDKLKTESVKVGIELDTKSAKNAIKSLSAEQQKLLGSDKIQLDNRVSGYLKNNSKLSTELRGRLLEVQKQIQSVDKTGLNNLKNEFKEVSTQATALGQVGKTTFQKFKGDIGNFLTFVTAGGAVMGAINGIRDMTTNVKLLDDELLELSKVSDLSADGLAKVTEQAYTLGDTVGKTGTQVLGAITSFKRAGYDIAESMKLATDALKMTNVAEGIEDAGIAAENLIHILNGYDAESNFSTHILDAINEVSNTQAVDFDNLVDGAERLSAVANQAGVSFEQMLGILTGGYSVLGDMEKVASGAITIFTRLQSIQLEGEDGVATVAKLQDTFSKATNGVVNIVDETTGQLRSAFDILNDLSTIWDDLDKNTQSALAFEAAGTRQKSVFLSIVDQWDIVKDSVQSANDSMGSADIENQKYLDSLSGRLEAMSSQFQELSQTVVDGDFLKNLVSGGTVTLDVLTELIDKFGLFNIALVTMYGVMGSKTGLFTTLVGQIQMLILAQTGYTASTVKAAIAQIGLAGTIKATAIAMKSFLLTNPAGWALLAVGAIAGLVTAYDHFNVTLEENQEKLSSLKSEYDSLKTEISSLNSELETTQSRIDELNRKDSLTLTEQEELDKLEKANKSLERQLIIQQELANIKAKDVEDQAITTMGQKSAVSVDSKLVEGGYSGQHVEYERISRPDAILERIDAYNQESQTIDELIKKQADLTRSGKTGSPEFEDLTDDIKSATQARDDYYQYVLDNTATLEKEAEGISGVTEEGKRYKSELENVTNAVDEFLNTNNTTTASLNNTDKAIQKEIQSLYSLATVAKEATGYVNDLGSNVDISKLQDSMSNAIKSVKDYQSILDDIKKNKGISSDNIETITSKYPQLLKYIGNEKTLREELTKGIENQKKSAEEYYKDILSLDEQYYNSVLNNHQDLIKQFQNQFNINLEDFKSLAEAKYKVDAELVNKLSDLWSKFYNAQLLVKDVQSQASKDIGWIPDAFENSVDNVALENAKKQQAETSKAYESYRKQVDAAKKSFDSIDSDLSFDASKIGSTIGKGGNKGQDKKSTQLIDWINRKLEILQTNLDIIKKRASDVLSLFGGQNKELDKAIKNLKSQVTIQEQAYKSYMKQANAVKLSSSLEKKVQNGSMNITEYSDTTAKKIEEYQKWYDAAQKVKQTIVDLKLEEKELAKQKIDNVIDDYDRKKSLQDALISKRESQISNREASGGSATESDYNYLIDRQNNVKTNLQKEYDKVKTEFNDLLADGTIKKYSDDWYDYKEILVGIETELVGCDEEVENLKDSIEKLRWKPFEDAIAKIERVKDEISDVQGLLSGDNFNDNGDLTDTGLTNLALNFQGINQSKQAIADYDLAIRSLDKSQSDYNEKLAEYQSAQRQAAQDIKAYKDAIIDFKKNAIEAETEAMRKNVQAKKESLQAEQDLHNYRNSIADKEQDINTLNKKIEALKLSTDRKDIAMRLALEQERAEAQKELSETQYDHNIETKQNALDEELSSFEELQNDKINELENSTAEQERVIKSYLNDVTNNYDSVYQNINTLADNYGISLTDSLQSPWESAKSAAQLYYDYVNEMGANVSIGGSSNSNVSNLIGEQGSHNTSYSKDSGASDLNKYLASKGYKTFSYDEASIVKLAQALGVSGISKESDVDNSKAGLANKNKILAALKKAGFSSGGFIDARSVGEDGYALVKHGEAVLKVDESKALQQIAPVFPLLNNLVKAYTPNLSNIPTKSNSTPIMINSPLVTITGVTRDEINSETQRQIQQIPKEIMKTLGQYGVR